MISAESGGDRRARGFMIESKYLKDNIENIQKLMAIPALRDFETKSLGKMDIDRVKKALLAEFDLATGQIKNLIISDWNLLKWQEEPESKEK